MEPKGFEPSTSCMPYSQWQFISTVTTSTNISPQKRLRSDFTLPSNCLFYCFQTGLYTKRYTKTDFRMTPELPEHIKSLICITKSYVMEVLHGQRMFNTIFYGKFLK